MLQLPTGMFARLRRSALGDVVSIETVEPLNRRPSLVEIHLLEFVPLLQWVGVYAAEFIVGPRCPFLPVFIELYRVRTQLHPLEPVN